MKKVAKFHKVSEKQFIGDWQDTFGQQWTLEQIKDIYGSLKLPRRATAGSAGYDFYSPLEISLKPGAAIKIPTGIRAWLRSDWVLSIYPRSGLGFKFRMQMNNTVGIVDSDYFDAENEGHIFIKVFNDGREGKTVDIAAGMAFAQGIFMEYGITEDDDATGERTGGFGSTDG